MGGPPTPGGHYRRTPFEHHPSSAPGIASGAPAPSAAQSAADAAERAREDRPSSTASKKLTTEDARSRLDEIKMHHPSPRDKIATPPNRSPSELRRMEDVRPMSGYH